jgi:DNA-binding NarL/FixJ family response regulator
MERVAVLVDQHPLWLEAVERVARHTGVDVIAKATSSTAALVLVEEHRPDILVTGLKMPSGEIDGLTLIRQARESLPSLRVVVLSMYDDPEHIDAAFAAGAAAYVIKTAHPDDIGATIRQAFEHSVFIPSARQPLKADVPLTNGSGLTRREIEILRLVADGHSNMQLAQMLWVTEQTVKFHLSNIYRKLGVTNRTEASRWAQLNGLLSDVSDVPSAAADAG